MSKIETVHDVVFKVYDLKFASKDIKDKIRKYINRQLETEYRKSWAELSSVEKDTFIYITIRQKMLTRYVDASKKNKINQSIDTYLKKTFLDSDSAVRKFNSIREPIYQNYFDMSDDDSTKKEKYALLCNTIRNFNPQTPIPTYEEWINYPLRPYDYIASFENEPLHVNSEIDYPSQAEIDHVILQVILTIFKEQFQKDIDIPLIKECLTYLKNCDIDSYDTLLTDYDPNINLPKEEQEQIIQATRKYFTYKKMLDDLSFII